MDTKQKETETKAKSHFAILARQNYELAQPLRRFVRFAAEIEGVGRLGVA